MVAPCHPGPLAHYQSTITDIDDTELADLYTTVAPLHPRPSARRLGPRHRVRTLRIITGKGDIVSHHRRKELLGVVTTDRLGHGRRHHPCRILGQIVSEVASVTHPMETTHSLFHPLNIAFDFRALRQGPNPRLLPPPARKTPLWLAVFRQVLHLVVLAVEHARLSVLYFVYSTVP